MIEHVAFRRSALGLSGALSAYAAHHRRRAARARWALGELHSVVIPCYGHASYVEEALASVLREAHRPLQLVLIDDASPDDTGERLRAFAAQRHDGVAVRVIRRRTNGGQAAAINLAVLHAAADAITIVNDDDLLLEGAITAARAVLAEHRAYLVGGDCVIFEGEVPPCGPVDQRHVADWALPLSPRDVVGEEGMQTNITHTGSTFLRSAWWAARGYRPWARTRIVVPSDRDFHLRVGALFGMVAVLGEPLSLWRWGTSVDSERFT